MLLPAAVLVLGFVSVLFFQLPRHLVRGPQTQPDTSEAPAPALD
jgi:hypothetical protein